MQQLPIYRWCIMQQQGLWQILDAESTSHQPWLNDIGLLYISDLVTPYSAPRPQTKWEKCKQSRLKTKGFHIFVAASKKKKQFESHFKNPPVLAGIFITYYSNGFMLFFYILFYFSVFDHCLHFLLCFMVLYLMCICEAPCNSEIKCTYILM